MKSKGHEGNRAEPSEALEDSVTVVLHLDVKTSNLKHQIELGLAIKRVIKKAR